MSGILGNPKVLVGLIVAGIVFIVSLAGGALGNAFGFGFLSSPLAAIQIPAEPIFADELFPGFKLMNTMVTTWITIVILIIVSYLATRNLSEVPRGIQNLVEVFIEFFLNLSESIAGPERARRFFFSQIFQIQSLSAFQDFIGSLDLEDLGKEENPPTSSS